MDISIVILTWNSERHISQCLNSIFEDLKDSLYSYEIFVVDNGSTDNTVPLIERTRKDQACLVPIYLDRNRGTTYSRNLALMRSRGRYICIMDSDVVIGRGTLQELINVLDKVPNAGLVVPKLVYPDGRLQKSTDHFPTIFGKIRRFFGLRDIEKREAIHKHIETLSAVDYAISAMWMMRKEILDKVGLLDEKIFYSPEDVDYCLRIWKAGYRILYDPHHVAIHDAQERSRQWMPNRLTVSHIKGLLYLFWKHRYIFANPYTESG